MSAVMIIPVLSRARRMEDLEAPTRSTACLSVAAIASLPRPEHAKWNLLPERIILSEVRSPKRCCKTVPALWYVSVKKPRIQVVRTPVVMAGRAP